MNAWLLLLYLTAVLAFSVAVTVWVVPVILGRGEVAEHPDRPDEYAAGVRIYLTEEQVAASIAELEQHFPKTKDRRIR